MSTSRPGVLQPEQRPRSSRAGSDPASPPKSEKRSGPAGALVSSFHTSALSEKASVLLPWLIGRVGARIQIGSFYLPGGGAASLSAVPLEGVLSGLLITMFSPGSLPSLTVCYTGNVEVKTGTEQPPQSAGATLLPVNKVGSTLWPLNGCVRASEVDGDSERVRGRQTGERATKCSLFTINTSSTSKHQTVSRMCKCKFTFILMRLHFLKLLQCLFSVIPVHLLPETLEPDREQCAAEKQRCIASMSAESLAGALEVVLSKASVVDHCLSLSMLFHSRRGGKKPYVVTSVTSVSCCKDRAQRKTFTEQNTNYFRPQCQHFVNKLAHMVLVS